MATNVLHLTHHRCPWQVGKPVPTFQIKPRLSQPARQLPTLRTCATAHSDDDAKMATALRDLASSTAKLMWGRSLPPGALVQVAEGAWTTMWQVMMSQLAPSKKDGSYDRPQSAFRDVVAPGSSTFPPEARRYHLYAALSCPWAHRATIVHALKGLQDVVPLSVAVPGDSGLWVFQGNAASRSTRQVVSSSSSPSPPSSSAVTAAAAATATAVSSLPRLVPTEDRATNSPTLRAVYSRGGKQKGFEYEGRATVPMLWDARSQRVVNNESADIVTILNSAFDTVPGTGNPALNLAPAHLKKDMEEWDARIYSAVNNGVYKAGFATSQAAHEAATESLFAVLAELDDRLGTRRFLLDPEDGKGPTTPTLSDIRLFTTLFRFDAVYVTLFKCTRRRLVDYKHLHGYMADLYGYSYPAVASTCDLGVIMRSYYKTLFPLNPGGIVPPAPEHMGHEALLAAAKQRSSKWT